MDTLSKHYADYWYKVLKLEVEELNFPNEIRDRLINYCHHSIYHDNVIDEIPEKLERFLLHWRRELDRAYAYEVELKEEEEFWNSILSERVSYKWLGTPEQLKKLYELLKDTYNFIDNNVTFKQFESIFSEKPYSDHPIAIYRPLYKPISPIKFNIPENQIVQFIAELAERGLIAGFYYNDKSIEEDRRVNWLKFFRLFLNKKGEPMNYDLLRVRLAIPCDGKAYKKFWDILNEVENCR